MTDMQTNLPSEGVTVKAGRSMDAVAKFLRTYLARFALEYSINILTEVVRYKVSDY